MSISHEYLTEVITDSRFKTKFARMDSILKKPTILSICKEITTKLESFGFTDFTIEPDKKWKVFDIEESEPTSGRHIVLQLFTLGNDGDEYMAEYGGDAIQQFDMYFGTKETGRFVLYDVVDVTDKFSNVPEHVHIYAQNHVGLRGNKFNDPNFVLSIPANEIQELWDKFND